jgi:hypothetical protein
MAKKSKEFRELLYQQQSSGSHEKSMKQMARKIKTELKDKIADVVVNPKGEVKMSEVLEAFVEPYLETTHNREQRLKLLTIAIFAWNLTLLAPEQQQSELERVVEELSAEDARIKQDIQEILNELIERKQKFFAENKRYIIDFDLKETRRTYNLSVISSLIPDASTGNVPEASDPEANGPEVNMPEVNVDSVEGSSVETEDR